jgi:hypothetical protein
MMIAGVTGHVWEGIDDKPLPRGWKRVFIVIGFLLALAGILFR